MTQSTEIQYWTARAGNLRIGSGNPIVIQTMCDTRTSDVDATLAQCLRLHHAGAQLIRITVPGPTDVECLKAIKEGLRARGVETPLVADIHFSSRTAILAARVAEKVRINPGNFHRDHTEARMQFAKLLEVCKEGGTAIRIGVNHGSLGDYITGLYGNTPEAMAKAAMEWLEMCVQAKFFNVVVSLKSSTPRVLVDAYRSLVSLMAARGHLFPLHLGVTEAGNGDSGRIKSCVGISTLLSEGIGDTIRVSLTEDPENELPVAAYLAARYDRKITSSLESLRIESRKAVATYRSPSRETLLFDFSCDFGKRLLDKELDELELAGTYVDEAGKEISIEGSGTGATQMNSCRRPGEDSTGPNTLLSGLWQNDVRPTRGLRNRQAAHIPSLALRHRGHGLHRERAGRNGGRRLDMSGRVTTKYLSTGQDPGVASCSDTKLLIAFWS